MAREAFRNGRFLLALFALAAALSVAAGCGSSSSGDDEVTIQTGSLSKAEFIEKADAACEASRTELEAKLRKYFQDHEEEVGKADKEDEFFSGMLETVIAPNFEAEIQRISSFGAPKDYAPEAAAFLNSLQRQIEEAHSDISKLEDSRFPFEESAKAAKKAGMQGCSESFG